MIFLIFQNHCQERFELSTHRNTKNGEKVFFVLLSSHRDLLKVICDFVIHTKTLFYQKEKKLIVLQVLCCLLLRGAPFSSQGLGQMLPIQVSSSI